MQATQDKNRVTSEINELKDHVDIKDRKINVLQRKVRKPIHQNYYKLISSRYTFIILIMNQFVVIFI